MTITWLYCLLSLQPLSISEMFAKQLMQLHGLTAEKAAAVVDKYSTPKAYVSFLCCMHYWYISTKVPYVEPVVYFCSIKSYMRYCQV